MVLPSGRDTLLGSRVKDVLGLGHAAEVRKRPFIPVFAMAVDSSGGGSTEGEGGTSNRQTIR
jgi:hypothetical protein